MTKNGLKERIKPTKIINTPKGEIVIDMGQNITGWIEMRIKASKDFKVIVQHGEILQEGNFFKENLRSALQEFHFISDGKESVVHPHFTFYGLKNGMDL